MSYRYWTADIHANHGNIARYANRPWLRRTDVDEHGQWVSVEAAKECGARMTDGLIANMNARIGPGDCVVHVGDFLCRGSERGIPGSGRLSFDDLLTKLNGRWTFVMGNHDRNNGVKHGFESLVVELGKKRALVRHVPCSAANFELVSQLDCEFVICGHVHTYWKHCMLFGIPHINVGVDATNYFPLTDSEVLGRLAQCRRKANEKVDSTVTAS